MPKIFLHYPKGVFTDENLGSLTAEMTTIGLQCERIPQSPYGKSTVWIYANEYPVSRVFVGGVSGGTGVVSVEVNAFQGGLDDQSKQELIERFTECVARWAGIKPGQRPPVFVVIRDTSPSNWGIFGKQTTLEMLRNPRPDAVPV